VGRCGQIVGDEAGVMSEVPGFEDYKVAPCVRSHLPRVGCVGERKLGSVSRLAFAVTRSHALTRPAPY
jgi:hypothetical protein